MLRTATLLFALTLPVLAAPAPAGKANPTEIHVVALYEARNAVPVHVDRPGVEVILVLSGHTPVEWAVSASEKTKLVKVVLGGYGKQSAKVPEGTTVEDRFRDNAGGKPRVDVRYKPDGRFREALQGVRAATGQEIRSFQGQYRIALGEAFAVDRVSDDPRLSSTFPELTKAADLPKVAFQATRVIATSRHEGSASYGDFTQAGPDKASLRPLPKGIVRVAGDAKGKKLYGLNHHDLFEIDPEKKTAVEIKKGVNFSWPSALTFDGQRGRVVIAARSDLIEYDAATGKWANIAALPRTSQVVGLAHHADDDLLYALDVPLAGDDGGTPVLHQMNAQGAILKSEALGAPMFPGVAGGRGPTENRVQLVSAGKHLAVLINGPKRGENGEAVKAESFLYVIDPKDFKVTLGWKE